MDLLVLLAMILGGTWFAVWFLTSPLDLQRHVMDGSLKVVLFGLAQPGVLLGVWILMKSSRPLRWRIAMGVSTIAALGFALPLSVVRLFGDVIANI